MKQKIIDKILKHAKDNEIITLKSTSEFVGIHLKTAEKYLMAMTLQKKLVMKEEKKNLAEGEVSTGYTYKSWRINE